MIARGTAANRAITSGRFLVPLPFCSQALSKQYLGRHLKTSSAGQSLDRGTMAGTDPTEIEKGDTVEWKWGGAKHISGEVRGVGLLGGGPWDVPKKCVLLHASASVSSTSRQPAAPHMLFSWKIEQGLLRCRSQSKSSAAVLHGEQRSLHAGGGQAGGGQGGD